MLPLLAASPVNAEILEALPNALEIRIDPEFASSCPNGCAV